jgi:tetratricopeptide (TPR) repeat protein
LSDEIKQSVLEQKARDAYKQGKLDEAVELCSQAIAFSTQNASLRKGRASALISLGRYSEALGDLDFAIKYGPPSADVHAMRGYARLKLMKSDGDDPTLRLAMEDVSIALKLSPADSDSFVLYVRGLIAAKTQDYDRAVADFSCAIEHGYDSAEARCLRASSFAMKGEIDRAIVDLTEAIKQAPAYAPSYTSRARLYTEKGEFERAIADLTQAIRLNPNDGLVYLQRANLLGSRGNRSQALADVNEAARRNTDRPEIRSACAVYLYYLGDYRGALKEADAAATLHPTLLHMVQRCLLNAQSGMAGPCLRDLGLCVEILLDSRVEYRVIAGPAGPSIGIACALATHRWGNPIISVRFNLKTHSLVVNSSL